MRLKEQEQVTKQIKNASLNLLAKNPDGLQYSELLKKIMEMNPGFKRNTIQGCIWNLGVMSPARVYKPSRGLFRLLEHKPVDKEELKKTPLLDAAVSENERCFYEPFSLYLKNDLREVTEVIPLGGTKFKGKWGTPDVIGKYESKHSDVVKGTTEIVSAEIKTDTNQLIIGFGQVCAFKLFSHKVYLVIPEQSLKEDIFRLSSLCQICGVGLIIFDKATKEVPNFRILVRAVRHEPDLFYTNQNMAYIRELFPYR